MEQDLLSQDKRIFLEKLLSEIEAIEADLANPINCTKLLGIINQAQTEINASNVIGIKERTVDVLCYVKTSIQRYKNESSANVYDLVEITNKSYVAIDAFLTLSYQSFQKK